MKRIVPISTYLKHYLFMLMCVISMNAFAQEGKSFNLMSGLQQLGANLGQIEEELLPP
ncbi:MAG: hypothetical protein H0Z20_04550, partial [Nitrosospira sp.]|nr:hypothetical protein [Nitrosospira sp.]